MKMLQVNKGLRKAFINENSLCARISGRMCNRDWFPATAWRPVCRKVYLDFIRTSSSGATCCNEMYAQLLKIINGFLIVHSYSEILLDKNDCIVKLLLVAPLELVHWMYYWL